MTEREEFEKRFPVPKGIEWINDAQGYRITSDDDYWWDTEGQAHFRGYLGQWLGWQAAREQEGGEFVADDEPLPCPFCGNSPHRMSHPDPSYPQIQCRNIECPIGVTTEEVSLESWNVRAHPPESQGVPGGWRVARANHSAKAIGTEVSGFLIQSPRVNGVGANTSVWEDSESPTERLLYLMLSAAPQADSFQNRVAPWMQECFGPEISADRTERNHRFLEEALELVQSLGCTSDEAHQLVDYVFGREVGEPFQEVGGVRVTLAALCLANNLDQDDCAELELARITQPQTVKKIREKQKRKPSMSPLPGVYPERPQPPEQGDGV